MQAMTIAALLAAAASTASAAECQMAKAVYGQAGSNWTLQFTPIPRDAAANQVAAFTVELPNSGDALVGAVHVPNGFGSSSGWIDEPACTASADEVRDDPEVCALWHATVYALDGEVLGQLPQDDSVPAPAQILLPEFAEAVWYSLRRDAEWAGDQAPGDAFTFARCAD
ncbi:hypothetical protein [Devosia sp.]|uniref:hypothetical protein n=1 Tax=Devosia sp. TaxID=1871048 RepID=UPI003A8E06CE